MVHCLFILASVMVILDILKVHFTGLLMYLKNNSPVKIYAFICTNIVLITCLPCLFLADHKTVSYLYTKL